MKKKTVMQVMLVAVLVTISLYFIGGTYARYASTFEGDTTAEVAKWAVKLGEDDGEGSNMTLNLAAEENDDVVAGKIAPSVTLSDDVEIDLAGTEVSVDVIAEVDKQAVETALQSAGLSAMKDDIKLTVKVDKDPLASFEITGDGDGSQSKPYVIQLPSGQKFGENDKLKVTISMTWDNNEENNTLHTKAGESLASISSIPVKLHVVQHIDSQLYTPSA